MIELAMTSFISNKREWNNCLIKFLKLQKFEVRNTREKSEKIRAKLKKKRDEDAMLCNTLWSDIRTAGSSQKHLLPFRVSLNVGIDPNFQIGRAHV